MNRIDCFFENSKIFIPVEDKENVDPNFPSQSFHSMELMTSAMNTDRLTKKIDGLRDEHEVFTASVEQKKVQRDLSQSCLTEFKTLSSPLTEEVIDYFTYQEAAEWFSLSRKKNGGIKFALPSSLRKIERLIYIFRNKEKKCDLIGKTGGSLNKRCSGYASLVNKEGTERKVREKGRKAFLTDIKQNPEHFEVGILHVLQPEEDLNLFESLFIECKGKVYKLYNDRSGGGGGLSHAEESSSVYAIPKPETGLFTPEKYYRFGRDDRGSIRPQFSPNFKPKLERLRDHLEETQEYTYAIKDLDTGKRYIGITGNPEKRAKEHGYAAEYCDSDHAKYDPDRISGCLHPAMAEDPNRFGIGILPVRSLGSINSEELENYVLLTGIGKVERYAIEIKQSLVSQNGFNCNRGGGGPISSLAQRRAIRRLDFSK